MLFNIEMSSGENKNETTKNKQDEMSERVRKIIQYLQGYEKTRKYKNLEYLH